MRKILFIIPFLLTIIFLVSQDTLHKTDGTKHIIKTIEINETQVKYKLISNINGPIYVINKDNIIKIVNETGLIDTFPKKIIKNIIQDPRNIDFGRNFISLNVADFLFGFLTIGYEYTSKSGKYSLKFPLSFGLYSNSNSSHNGYWGGYYNYWVDYHNDWNNFSTGFDFYLYPFGQGKAKFFFGPSLVYGQFNFWNYNPHLNYTTKERGTYYAFLLQNGFLFQPSKHFNLSINAGIGLGYTKGLIGNIAARGGLNIGYKF